MAEINVRKGMPSVQLDKAEFKRRFLAKFYDPDFEPLKGETRQDRRHRLGHLRRVPQSPARSESRAGLCRSRLRHLGRMARHARQYSDRRAAARKTAKSPSRVLIVNGSSRSDQTCPGEMSKTYRLVTLAKEVVEKTRGFEVEVLDLSRLTSEYGRVIYPCKACVSTAQPLCHWPCSCYPNHALGQAGDWMAEIYPKWVAAHGVMIVCPVNWYQAPSSLKLMIDRLVCADGGNPDPTSTHGKDAAKAKELELKGWPYPRHLAGRVFSVVVHGDAAGTENLRRILTDWMIDIGMIPVRPFGLDRPLCRLSDALRDQPRRPRQRHGFPGRRAQCGTRTDTGGKDRRSGKLEPPDRGLHEARPK